MLLNGEKAALIVPCYNEGHRFDIEHWKKLIGKVQTIFIFVDDGSNDNTLEFLEELCSHNAQLVRVLKLANNQGKAEATRFGLQKALENNKEIELVGYLDADTSIDEKDVNRILSIAKEFRFDIVMGSRVKLLGRQIRRSPTRHLVGRIVVTFLSIGISQFPYDSQCGIKVFRATGDLKRILAAPFKTRWFLDLEIMTRLGKPSDLKIWEEPLYNWVESAGSKIRLTQYPSIVREIFNIKRIIREKWI